MTQPIDMTDRHTVRETSRITGWSTEYIRVMARGGKLDAVKLGHQYFVKLPERSRYEHQPLAQRAS